MKHPLFAAMGGDYPKHLEAQYDRILTKIEQLWSTPEIDDYFSDLLIDRRGGRKGFPHEVARELIMLREFHELENFRAAERTEDAMRQLAEKRIPMDAGGFLLVFREGNQELVDLFVRSHFPLPFDDNGEPLILAALKRGHTVVAKIILGAGADVNLRNRLGLTALLVACGKTTHGYRVITEALIAKGANVNVRDPLGNTPLLLALSGQMFDIAALLVQHGANVFATSPKGVTPVELARSYGTPEALKLVELMLSRQTKPE